jgi:hypothetical protein
MNICNAYVHGIEADFKHCGYDIFEYGIGNELNGRLSKLMQFNLDLFLLE